MPRYILICQATSHACPITRQEMTQLIGMRWTSVEKTLAIVEAADEDLREMTGKKTHYAVAVEIPPMGTHTIHVEGLMESRVCRNCTAVILAESPLCPQCGAPQIKKLDWLPPGHRCEPRCLLPGKPVKTSQSQFGYRGKR